MLNSWTAVTLQEYLSTSYRPDVEYLEGELKARAVVSPVHGRVQMVLGLWFGNHEDEWHVLTVAEARTQVRVERVRLPDVAVLAAGPLPDKVLVDPPIVVIEVLSETDSYKDLKARALDMETMGVKNVWLLDPEKQTAEVWSGGAWVRHQGARLQALNSPVYLDLEWLWAKLAGQRT